MKAKVLFFADWYLPGRNGGGAVTALVNLVNALGDELDLYIFTRDRDSTDTKPYTNVALDSWTSVGHARVLYTSDLSFRNIRRRIKEVDPQVVYLGSVFSRLTIRALLLRWLRLLPAMPVVLAPRGELGRGALMLKRWRKWTYFQVAVRIGLYHHLLWHAASELEYEQIRRRIFRSEPRLIGDIRIAHTIPSPGLFQEPTKFLKSQKYSGKCRFVFLSRIARNKNLLWALDLLACISGDVSLDIYGPVDDVSYWAECYGRMQTLPPNIIATYAGAIRHEAVPSILAAHDFLLLPTLGENFCYVILEALSAGCPVIISDQSPWRDLPKIGVGWDIPLDHKERWQSILSECVEMGDNQYKVMSLRSRAVMRKWYESIDFRAEHIKLLQEALCSKAEPSTAPLLTFPERHRRAQKSIGSSYRP